MLKRLLPPPRTPLPLPRSSHLPLRSAPRRLLSSLPPRSNQYNRFPGSRQREPFPSILSEFNKKVLDANKNKVIIDIPSPTPRGGKFQQEGGSGGGGGSNGGNGAGGGARGFFNSLYPKQKLAVLGIVGGGGYYAYHLERVPETGRLRFMDLSPAAERQVAAQTFHETLREYKSLILPPSHPTSKFVERVARRIVEGGGLGKLKGSTSSSSPMGGWGGGLFGDTGLGGGDEWERNAAVGKKGDGGEEIEWEVFVINDPKTKNAFVLPGGKIFVFTGILPVCANEDGLASVLGHEVAHQVARHSAERMSSLKVLSLLGFVLEAVGLDVGLSRLLLTFLLSLPNSRKAESEADFIGLRLMSKACFDPRESPKMWTRMSTSETGNTSSWAGVANLDFMSTHPANGKRIKAIESWLPEALNVRAASPTCGDMVGQYEAFREETHLPRRVTPQPVLLGGERMGRW